MVCGLCIFLYHLLPNRRFCLCNFLSTCCSLLLDSPPKYSLYETKQDQLFQSYFIGCMPQEQDCHGALHQNFSSSQYQSGI